MKTLSTIPMLKNVVVLVSSSFSDIFVPDLNYMTVISLTKTSLRGMSGMSYSLIIDQELLNLPSNRIPVRLEIFAVMSHNILSTVIIAWQTSALHTLI